MISVNQREIVLDILMEINEKGEFSHNVLKAALTKYQYLEKQERAFLTIVTEGTMENLIRIDYVINRFSKVKTKKMKPLILNLLRMSVYQLLFMDAVPDSAVCNEAVKLATKRGFYGLKGFVNGVLREIARNKETIAYPDASKDLLKHFSVVYSMPEWIVEQWIYQYGTEEAGRILKGCMEHDRRTSVRCNTSKISLTDCIALLEKEGVTVERNPYVEEALYLSGFDYLMQLTAFREGYLAVQDTSSMFVGKVAAPKKGDYCIDLCAAPGGKTAHLLDLLGGSGMVEARDVSEYKTGLIQSNMERMKFQNVVVKVKDAFEPDEEEHVADLVIADLPCSGLGVVGKKSDIRYNMTPEKQKSLVEVQREILRKNISLMKEGGTLIFSTCTTNREENYENYRWLIDEMKLIPEDISSYFPQELQVETMKEGYVQFLQGIVPMDGFFISRFTNK